MKREEKAISKYNDREVKALNTQDSPVQIREVKRAAPTIDTNADFLSFNDVDVTKYTTKNKSGIELLGGPSGDSVDDIETRISKKYDRDQYPWISDFTLKIKDAFIFLHNEILDFQNFIESSPEDLKTRKQVVTRVKNVVR